MQFKWLLGIRLLTILIAVTLIGSRQGLSQRAQHAWKDPTTLRTRVEKEKAKGYWKVVFPSPQLEYADETNLESAIGRATASGSMRTVRNGAQSRNGAQKRCLVQLHEALKTAAIPGDDSAPFGT